MISGLEAQIKLEQSGGKVSTSHRVLITVLAITLVVLFIVCAVPLLSFHLISERGE